VVVHLLHLGLAHAQFFDHHSDELFGDVDRQVLDRFHQLAIDALGHDFGLGDGKFVAFSTHHLDQDRELQFAASQDLERVRS
jgi:hypothetical protein